MIHSIFIESARLQNYNQAITKRVYPHPQRAAALRQIENPISCKYAVTLYELLESVANKINPVLDAPIDILWQWLKVADGKLSTWDNFNRRAPLACG
jgi:hypothetical protein